MFTASATGATPKIEIGTAASGEEIVASVSATTDLGALTIVEGTIAAGGDIFVTVICTASDTVTQGNLTFVGHVLAPPTTLEYRG
jgi:ABC-type iron transport system FetAB ATPase subunit